MSDLALDALDRTAMAEALVSLKAKGARATETRPVNISLAFSQSPEPAASAVLAAGLMTALRAVPLRVSHSADPLLVGVIVRSGLAAALKARPGSTSFANPNDALDSPQFSATWTPGSRSAMAAMFAPLPLTRNAAQVTETGLFGPDHALFINPHRTTGRSGPASVTRLVRRWLTQRLNLEQRVLENAAFTLDQLVTNIDQHAVREASPSVTSQVRLEIDRHRRRLVVVVLDSGPGLIETLRAKDDHTFPTDDVDLMGTLLAGKLPGWGAARGVGLARLRERVTEAAGQLSVLSGGVQVEAGRRVSAQRMPLGSFGTVLVVQLPIT